MTESRLNAIADRVERQTALDIQRSFIVQAPAGSGKTELLIQRILSLLAVVKDPAEVLAITFTRKAAAEMQVRLLDALEQAATEDEPDESYRKETWQRARQVLAQDQQQGWNLRKNPTRLQIMTIDSFCSKLSRRMPWIARLGEQPGICEDPDQLYLQAAENLLDKLEADTGVSGSIEFMLQHLDNRLVKLRELLVAMLAKRDQWVRYLIDKEESSRELLESALQQYVSQSIDAIHGSFGAELCREMVALATYAAENTSPDSTNSHPHAFADYHGDLSEGRSDQLQWLALADLFLTGKDELRKQVNVRNGFPSDKSEKALQMKQRMLNLLNDFTEDETYASAFRTVRALPTPSYDERQWQALSCLIELLPMAVIELQGVFRSSGQVDFIEVAGSARLALGSIESPEDLLLHLDSTINHILVDEYQDTSFTQFDLLLKLTAGWQPDDGRTLFVVGDPMQSIYRFREADVGLFLQATATGIGTIKLEPLSLKSNFRSQAGLVDWFNQVFPALFASNGDVLTGAVPYEPAVSVRPADPGPAVTHCYHIERNDADEADKVLALVNTAQKNNPDETIAVLVRSRNHLKQIIRHFRDAGLRFQAQDLDLLGDRPIAHDLMALTRALLHPGDSVAWFSVLRAPWCGLDLDDLLILAQQQNNGTLLGRIFEDSSQVEMFTSLSVDGAERLGKLRHVFSQARRNRGRVSLKQLVESTWMQLGGPAVVDAADRADANRIFELLDQLDGGGDLERISDLERGLAKLYATPDPGAGPELQVMTIHKAKGLEFDTVIVPGLGRPPRSGDKPLLRWLEHPDYGLLLAPVPPVGAEDDEIYRAIGNILTERDRHETLRLLYVAATRAKKQLHLLGHVRQSDDEMKAAGGSLLGSAWEAFEPEAEYVETVVDATDERLPAAQIRRLPVTWQCPEMAESIEVTDLEVVTASGVGLTGDVVSRRFSIRSDEGRIVGTVVHNWLEKITARGIDQSALLGIDPLMAEIRNELSTAGIPRDRLEECASHVGCCLRNSLNSMKGQWILTNHAESSSELELSGMIDGKLVHASIDRTFVDQGTRWVVDYKTSTPASGESLAHFLQNEGEKYRLQIETYVELFRQLEPTITVRGALYFPAVDAWQEIL